MDKAYDKRWLLCWTVARDNGLPRIDISEGLLTLVGKQKRLPGNKIDGGLAKLEEVRALIISLANVISENRYTTLNEYEVALNYLMGKAGATLPPPRPIDTPKAVSKSNGAPSIESELITNINAFVPEGNQIYAEQVLKDPQYGFAAIVGPAGTGKTELVLFTALRELSLGHYDRIVLCTPMVTVGGKEIGFLPGDKNEKISRWFSRHESALTEILAPPGTDGELDLVAGAKKLQFLLSRKIIDKEILEDMRGNNYKRTIIIVDEAQNADPDQTLTALTRICESSKIWLTGDFIQLDGRKLQAVTRKVPNYISLKDGLVMIYRNGRNIVLGEERKLGRFFISKAGVLSVKAHNGLCESVLYDTAVGTYGLAVLDRSDIHRRADIGPMLAIREASVILEETDALGRAQTGTFDAEAALQNERNRIKHKAARVVPIKPKLG